MNGNQLINELESASVNRAEETDETKVNRAVDDKIEIGEILQAVTEIEKSMDEILNKERMMNDGCGFGEEVTQTSHVMCSTTTVSKVGGKISQNVVTSDSEIKTVIPATQTDDDDETRAQGSLDESHTCFSSEKFKELEEYFIESVQALKDVRNSIDKTLNSSPSSLKQPISQLSRASVGESKYKAEEIPLPKHHPSLTDINANAKIADSKICKYSHSKTTDPMDSSVSLHATSTFISDRDIFERRMELRRIQTSSLQDIEESHHEYSCKSLPIIASANMERSIEILKHVVNYDS